ncbi:uncharacterized protein LOC125833118 [Solanum verrucosum]|uniref:uncharacterized protein LOC125833118 n=1 Tax=Solanum verrucosum TaxID=315347 RepID=UPI0020D0F495|nr:uncharacterized protein LOC125833118 [Solanum verrucosum]
MTQLSATLNLRQPGTLPNNTIQNPKTDGHCMAVTTRGGKQTIDPPILPPPHFPQRLVKKIEEGKYRRFISMLKQLSINVPLIEALEQITGYAKFMKDFVTKKRAKKEDLGAFTIPCTIGLLHFAKALCDLGASINLMTLAIYKKTVKKLIGVLQDVLVKVESFIIPADFVILDCDVEFEVPIILGRPFLAIGRTLVDMEKGQIKF